MSAAAKFGTASGLNRIVPRPESHPSKRRTPNDLITLFDFPPPIRKAIYTTNAIESINSVIRKFTRNRKQYPNAESALKLVYLAIHEASKHWTMPVRGWKAALNHFAIVFEDRLPASARN
jgi:transposase-like protein